MNCFFYKTSKYCQVPTAVRCHLFISSRITLALSGGIQIMWCFMALPISSHDQNRIPYRSFFLFCLRSKLHEVKQGGDSVVLPRPNSHHPTWQFKLNWFTLFSLYTYIPPSYILLCDCEQALKLQNHTKRLITLFLWQIARNTGYSFY